MLLWKPSYPMKKVTLINRYLASPRVTPLLSKHPSITSAGIRGRKQSIYMALFLSVKFNNRIWHNKTSVHWACEQAEMKQHWFQATFCSNSPTISAMIKIKDQCICFFKVFKIYKFRMRTCAIFTEFVVFFVYDLELFIDASVYKRHNSTMTFLVVKIDMRRSLKSKMSVPSPTATREEPAVNFDLFMCN